MTCMVPGHLRIEVTLQYRGDLLHTLQRVEGIRREIMQATEIRRIPSDEWLSSVNDLITACFQCRLDHGNHAFRLSTDNLQLMAQTMNETGMATEAIADLLPPINTPKFRWEYQIRPQVDVGTGLPVPVRVAGTAVQTQLTLYRTTSVYQAHHVVDFAFATATKSF